MTVVTLLHQKGKELQSGWRKQWIYNDYYFHYYFPEDNFKPTRKGDIIEDLMHYLYDLTNKQFKANAKWHKKNGEIFVYYKEGNVYTGGNGYQR